ncbi:sulfate transporter 1.1 isoform X1 [Selaginella moellendorffii]|nr:sulfate transporter 1.1 isoform X1 [Selaginella moellendorffii]|eukprot:XP_002968282.2 sulfate transporter 1.1 isoform X1 [Selaginella moellendorffii]
MMSLGVDRLVLHRLGLMGDIESNGEAYNGHKVMEVLRPPYKSSASAFGDTVKETFFPDDPFRQFRHQTAATKFVLAMRYMFPVLDWGAKYKFADLRADLVSGLTIASLSIPQGIAYAKLANLPPIYGLYSTFLPPLLYAIMGSSRDLAIGPSAILSLVLGTMLRQEADPVKEPELHLRLALTATFFTGVIQAGLGVFRLGFLIDFLSHATIVGFVSGVAVIICLQQLKGILGLPHFTTKSDIISVLHAVFEHPQQWNWRTIVIGVCFVTLCLVTKYIGTRNRKYFWLSAGAPMTTVVVTTFCTYITHAEKHGVSIVGHLKKGLNPISTHKLFLTGPYVLAAVKIAVVVAAIGLMEAIAIGRTFASMKGYDIDGNKEMIAFGVMNTCSACMSCYATTGAVSRSAVNFNAGCRTAFSNIVMSFVIMVTLLVLMPLFHYTPNVTLAAIIFAAVIGLIDPCTAYEIFKVDKIDFLACIAGFLGVIFISIQMGLVIAVTISLARLILQMTRPHTSLLGQIPGTNVFRNKKQYPGTMKTDGILVIRIDAGIYFSNANYIRERVFRWIADEEEANGKSGQSSIRYVIIDLTPVMNIDTSGIHGFENIQRILKSRGVQLAFANPGSGVFEKLHKSKFMESLGQQWMFLTVSGAVQVCSSLLAMENKGLAE